MLRQAAARRAPLRLARGDACHLPYQDGVLDLVYCVNAIHHFGQPGEFIAEARRLLRPGGTLAVIGADPHDHKDAWYIYDYFEGTYETDLRRFPSWGTVLDWMVGCGFEHIGWHRVEHIERSMCGRDVFADPFLAKESCSQLALLSDEAYAAGRKRLEADGTVAEARGETLTFVATLTLGMLTGRL
jgi:SAM-dependent methyltransferase